MDLILLCLVYVEAVVLSCGNNTSWVTTKDTTGFYLLQCDNFFQWERKLDIFFFL